MARRSYVALGPHFAQVCLRAKLSRTEQKRRGQTNVRANPVLINKCFVIDTCISPKHFRLSMEATVRERERAFQSPFGLANMSL